MLFLVITHVLAFALGFIIVCAFIYFCLPDNDDGKTLRSFSETKMPPGKPSHDARETSLKYQ